MSEILSREDFVYVFIYVLNYTHNNFFFDNTNNSTDLKHKLIRVSSK